MSDYISREKIIDKLNRLIEVERLQGTDEMGYGRERVSAYECMKAEIESECLYPSVDMVNVVRCKDCRFYKQGTMNFHGRCTWHGGLDPDEDWYCADGEAENERKAES